MRPMVLWLCALLPFTAAAQNFKVGGVVVDHVSGQPVHRVLVNLISSAKDGGSVSAVTESDGRFIFTDVPKGKYRLTAQRPGEVPQGYHQDDLGYGTALIVGPEAATDNLVFPLHTNASIKGLVIDEQGDPVSGAQVQLFLQSVVNGELQTTHHGSGNTNVAGQFHFGHLRPGTYFVAVSGRPWYSTAGQPRQQPQPKNGTDLVFPITWYGNTTVGDAASGVSLAEGSTVNIQIAMHAVPNVHVQLAAVAGTTSPGLSRQRAAVFANGPGGVRVNVFSNIFQNADGTRELNGISAGRYELAFNESNKAQILNGATQVVDLAEGATLAAAPESRLAVSGQVTFVDGEKPERELELSISSSVGRSAMAPVAGDGTFSIPNNQLGAGSYVVHLNTPGVWIQSMAVRGGKRAGERLELPSSGNVFLSIVAATANHLGTVKGFAVQNEAAFAGATMLLLPQELAETKLIRRDQSDSDGSFIIAGVVPGHYTLIAVESSSGLLYKTATVIKPYLAGGISLVVSAEPNDAGRVQVQKRLPTN